MSTPFPRPKHTDLLWYTDVAIKTLALAVDAAIGSAYRTSMLPAGYAISLSGTDSRAWITFPNLGVVSGALVFPSALKYVGGAVTTYPPVPPSGIGRVIPQTPVFITVVQYSSGGAVLIEGQSMGTNSGVVNGVTQQWGAQKAAGAPSIPLAGVAWGPA